MSRKRTRPPETLTTADARGDIADTCAAVDRLEEQVMAKGARWAAWQIYRLQRYQRRLERLEIKTHAPGEMPLGGSI